MTLRSLTATTVAGYRTHTGDVCTSDAVIEQGLDEAETLLNEHLRRKLASESRTGSFRIYPDGRVWPDAYPITASSLTIEGRALIGAEEETGPFVGVFEYPRPYATVTWTGGYTSTTLPVTLRQAVYELTKGLAQDAQPIPVGATAISVGDVSISYAHSSGGLDSLAPGLTTRVASYRNRWVG